MYFKNKIGTIYTIGNKLISETYQTKTTVEFKDASRMEEFFYFEIANFKLACLDAYGHC